MSDERPVSWRALQEGTPVRSSDSEELGQVSTIVADEEKDIFSGLAYRTRVLGPQRFVPAELIRAITPDGVHLSIAATEAERLENYDG